MDRFYQYPLGEYLDRTYFLIVSGEPDTNEVEDFAVAIHYNDSVADREVQIARIDTSHGYVHFDKLFREKRPKTPLDIDVYWEAEELLREDWRRYARRYETNYSADE
jgi:hypothetical protein